MKTWLILDCHNLCWRGYHALKYLSFKKFRTEIIFTLMRDVVNLGDLFQPTGYAFCFDSTKSLRAALCPTYKKKRREKSNLDETKKMELGLVRKQINTLRDVVLPGCGFSNIFLENGFEADDLAASIVMNLPKKDRAIIVSSDHDLYQLLDGKRVKIYCPRIKRVITEKRFTEEYGISPLQWIDAKALAGCPTDEIVGIKGVGEKTACKFLAGKLQDQKKLRSIIKGNKIWRMNRELVELPYIGCPKLTLRADEVSGGEWDEVMRGFGMKSLLGEVPMI